MNTPQAPEYQIGCDYCVSLFVSFMTRIITGIRDAPQNFLDRKIVRYKDDCMTSGFRFPFR
ncbi:hypothetical protein K8T06_15805, partial [bacterium]|nr:hypothetical protein [bacterium]